MSGRYDERSSEQLVLFVHLHVIIKQCTFLAHRSRSFGRCYYSRLTSRYIIVDVVPVIAKERGGCGGDDRDSGDFLTGQVAGHTRHCRLRISCTRTGRLWRCRTSRERGGGRRGDDGVGDEEWGSWL